MLGVQKYAKIEGGPVLPFDNQLNGSLLMTLPEAAIYLRISVSGMRRLQQGRHIPFVKVGGVIRFLKSDLIAYVQKQRVEPIDK